MRQKRSASESRVDRYKEKPQEIAENVSHIVKEGKDKEPVASTSHSETDACTPSIAQSMVDRYSASKERIMSMNKREARKSLENISSEMA